jgi:hypothetical protein
LSCLPHTQAVMQKRRSSSDACLYVRCALLQFVDLRIHSALSVGAQQHTALATSAAVPPTGQCALSVLLHTACCGARESANTKVQRTTTMHHTHSDRYQAVERTSGQEPLIMSEQSRHMPSM